MGLNRHAKRRDANEPEIRKALHKVGVMTWPLDTPVDLLCGTKEMFFLLEVKDGSKIPSQRALTASQEDFFRDTEGYPRFKVETVEDALEAVRGLRESPATDRSPQTKGVP